MPITLATIKLPPDAPNELRLSDPKVPLQRVKVIKVVEEGEIFNEDVVEADELNSLVNANIVFYMWRFVCAISYNYTVRVANLE